MSEKKGFILPYGTAKQIGRLIAISGEKAAIQFLEAIEQYSLDGTEPEGLDVAAEMLFEGMRKELDIDREKYNNMVEKNRRIAEGKRMSRKESTGDHRNPQESTGDRQKTVDSRQKIENIDSIVCAEPLIGLPLNDGTEQGIFPEDITEYSELYPSVDVMQELRNMRGWLLSNPGRRKTKRGIKNFITTWLAKEQDKPRARSGTTRKMTAEEILAIPAINPWSEVSP